MRVGRFVSAIAATMIALLAGIWLMVAPWLLGYPRPTAAWGDPVLIDFWTGVAVIVLAALALTAYGRVSARALKPVGAHVRARHADEVSATVARVEETPPAGNAAEPPRAAPAPQVPASAELDDILVPIATALLSDLAKRVETPSSQASEGGARG